MSGATCSSRDAISGNLGFEEAATLSCEGVTAWSALIECAHITAGDVVLVQGTGDVSTFAQFAKLLGATVIQISSSDAKLAQAKARGADHVINYQFTPDWDVEARRLTSGVGVDAVVEIGGAGTLQRSLRATRLDGVVATVGLGLGPGVTDPLPVISGVVRLVGVLVGSHDLAGTMNRAIAASDLKPAINRTFSFDEAREAYKSVASGALGGGKVVVSF